MDKFDEYLPEKKVKLCYEDQPFFTPELKMLDRKRKREFQKHRQSKKYLKLNTVFKKKCKESKKHFYKKFIEDLKLSNPRQWYSKVKRITNYRTNENDLPNCEEIRTFDDQMQAELIADTFEEVANMYEPLKDGDILLQEIPDGTSPKISINVVFNYYAK